MDGGALIFRGSNLPKERKKERKKEERGKFEGGGGIRTFVVLLNNDKGLFGIEIRLPYIFLEKIIWNSGVAAVLETLSEERKHVMQEFVVLVVQGVLIEAS